MQYVFTSLFALLICYSSFAQKGKEYFLVDSVSYDSLSGNDRSILDSLLPLYHKEKNDTVRLGLLNELVESLNEEKLWVRYNLLVHDQTYAALKNPGKLSKEAIKTLKKYYASSLQTSGYYQENIMGNLPKALEYYIECRKIQEEIKDLRGLGVTINNMAIVFQHQGNITKSLEYYMESLKIAESINEKQSIAYALNNVGTLYLLQGDTVTALSYQSRALKIREETGDKQGVIYSLGNLGSLYKAKGDFKKALYYFFECYRISEENGQKQGMGYSNQNIGTIYQTLWEQTYKGKKALPDSLFNESLKYFSNSLKTVEEIGDKRGITFNLYAIGKLYYDLNELEKATLKAKQSLKIAQEIGYPSLIKTSAELLYKIYKQKGQSKDALFMYELTIQMRDSIKNEETKKSTFKQQTKYEYEKQKALSDLEARKEIAVAEEGEKRQQIVSYSIGAGLLMLIVFSGFIFNRLRITRKQKHIIELQKGEVERQKQLVEVHQKEIIDSITYAKRLQEAILPPLDLVKKYLPDSFILYKPKDIVAGDFYWMEIMNDTVFIAAADCTGHGVPGAMVSVVCSNALNRTVKEFGLRNTGKILDKVTELVLETFEKSDADVKDGMDISLLAIDKTTKQISWSGANNPLWYNQNGQLINITADKQPIGKHDNRKPFTIHTISFIPNTTFYLFTDGFADQFGGSRGKKFMYKKFEENIIAIQEKPMEEQKKILGQAFDDWKGNLEQVDDVLIIGIKI